MDGEYHQLPSRNWIAANLVTCRAGRRHMYDHACAMVAAISRSRMTKVWDLGG